MDLSLDDILALTDAADSTVKDKEVGKEIEGEANPTAYLAKLPGALPPLGFFDPAGFTKGKSVSDLKRLREAELVHSRVSMLAVVGLLVGENFNPMFNGAISGVAINQFWQVPYSMWALIGMCIGIAETYRAQVGWVEPVQNPLAGGGPSEPTWFQLRTSYTAGDLGFDPLGLRPKQEKEYMAMQNKELSNGRLAMIAILGMVVQELLSGKEIFQQLGLKA